MKSHVFETESLLRVVEGVSCMGVEVQIKEPMNFHVVKSLGCYYAAASWSLRNGHYKWSLSANN